MRLRDVRLPFRLGKAFACDLSGTDVQDEAKKPGIPVLLPCALAAWAASAGAYATLEHAATQEAFAAACVLGVAFACLCIAFVLTRRSAVMLLAFLLVGGALGASASYAWHRASEDAPDGRERAVLELASDERATPFGSRCSVRFTTESGRSGKATAFLDEPCGLLSGARVECVVAFSPVSEDYRSRSYFSGESVQMDVEEAEEVALPAPLQAVYDLRWKAIDILGQHGGDQAGVLQALVCGYRGTIQDDGSYDAFKACGLAHVVAVSGAHLAIVTMVFGWLLKLLRAGRRLTLAASVAFVLAYLAFSGVPVSAVRAAIMVVLSLVAGVAGRRNATLNSLAVCLLAFLVTDPSSCVSVSLFLSAASTLGIVLFASLVASWMSSFPKALRSAVAEPVGLTLSSNLLTMPFSAASFGMLPVLSVPANVVATPLFSAACVCGLVCTVAGCAVPAVAQPAIGAASLAAFPLKAFVEWASALPFSSVEVDLPVVGMLVLSGVAAIALWAAWPKVSTAAFSSAMGAFLLAYVALAFGVPPGAGDSITMLDVGQGDAFLVSSCGQTLLIDTGNEDRKLRDALASVGVRRVDAVAVTHPDDDHCASLHSLASYADVGAFLCASPMLECGCGKCRGLLETARTAVGEEDVTALDVGDVLHVGRFELEVVWPESYEDKGGNADSLCLMARLDCDGDGSFDWKALFTGDAESGQLDAMLQAGLLEDVDVLKVGHHGSKASLDEKVLAVLKPELALVSCGEGNRYGHPAPDALNLLSSVGARVARTDESGTVRVRFGQDGVTLSGISK